MEFTKQDILSFFNTCEYGTKIPGLLPGRNYKFIGLEKYSSRGKYSHLNETDIIVIESENRKKRNLIKLSSEPIVILSNCSLDEIGYGKIPSAFVVLQHAENGPSFPNLYEYETQYKSIARYIKGDLTCQFR